MDDIEELGQRWQGIYRTLLAGPRRQIIGKLLEAPTDRDLSLPEAANLPDARLDPELLRTNLVHHHLPVMAEHGFVDWSKDPLVVSRGANFEDAAGVVIALDNDEAIPRHLRRGCHFFDEDQVIHNE